MKEFAIATLLINVCLLAAWIWKASRFTKAYNHHMAGRAKMIYLATIFFGHHAAGQGVAWLLRDGYRDCPSPDIVQKGHSLKSLTKMAGMFSITIPVIGLVWLWGII